MVFQVSLGDYGRENESDSYKAMREWNNTYIWANLHRFIRTSYEFGRSWSDNWERLRGCGTRLIKMSVFVTQLYLVVFVRWCMYPTKIGLRCFIYCNNVHYQHVGLLFICPQLLKPIGWQQIRERFVAETLLLCTTG